MDKNIIPAEIIMNKILFIRGQKVMIDRDLAELYGVPTKRLNEQVKRNMEKFPVNFMFQLNEQEFLILKSQIATSSWGGTRKLPYAFTEHGVLQLANVVTSEKATLMSIKIIEVFVKMREIFTDNLNLQLEIENIKKKLSNHDKNIELVFNYLDELMAKQEKKVQRNTIGYKK